MGYGDYQIGNVTISRVYYVEGLGHNLFSVGQFCDSNLEVAFRQHTCFIRNLEGVDLLTGSRGDNLYTFLLRNMMASVDNTSGPVPQRKERSTFQCALSSKEEKSSCILNSNRYYIEGKTMSSKRQLFRTTAREEFHFSGMVYFMTMQRLVQREFILGHGLLYDHAKACVYFATQPVLPIYRLMCWSDIDDSLGSQCRFATIPSQTTQSWKDFVSKSHESQTEIILIISLGPLSKSACKAHNVIYKNREPLPEDILGVTIQRAIKEILGDTTQRDIEEILGDTTQRDIKEILGDTTQRDIEEILGDITQRDIEEILGDTTQIDIEEILEDTTQRHIKEILGDTTQIDIEEILGDTTQRDIKEILGDTTQRDISMYLGNNISG
ncbi:hypothetical protein Tco_0619252 [Tanacetum coccineum]